MWYDLIAGEKHARRPFRTNHLSRILCALKKTKGVRRDAQQRRTPPTARHVKYLFLFHSGRHRSGQTERLGARMKQRCFLHRSSLFTGLVSMLICVVTLTAPAALAWAAATSGVATTQAAPSASSGQPNFGPNVYIFNPGMSQSEIQAKVDAVAKHQVSNQFGTQRYALLFEPGTYGSSTNPLNFQVGYYTTV